MINMDMMDLNKVEHLTLVDKILVDNVKNHKYINSKFLENF